MNNWLFICSRNQWRSPTAERIFSGLVSNQGRINTRSAGTSRHAKHTLSKRDIDWASHIFVMEQHHKNQLNQQFRNILNRKKVVVLDIPDDYHYMDAALIELLHQSMQPYLPLSDLDSTLALDIENDNFQDKI